jgi:hypothetical protein
MAKQLNNSTWSLKRLLFWAICFALVCSLSLFILEKAHIINLYTKPVTVTVNPTSETSTKQVNSVDYSPATDAEKPTTDQKTQDNNTTSAANSNPTQPITVTLSAAGQDAAGGPVIIRTILENATGGSCAITLSSNSTTKSYSSKITWQGTYYSCNYDIPYKDVSDGDWQLKIIATQDTKQGTATAVVKVK